MNNIKQEWVEYWLWEDYKNGFYNKSHENENKLIEKSIIYMKNHELFKLGMIQSVKEWSNSMLNNLTNPSLNKIAYIGQCSNCFVNKIPSCITKKAWKLLSKQEMDINNRNALEIYELWKKQYYPRLKNMRINGKSGVIKTEYQMKLNLR